MKNISILLLLLISQSVFSDTKSDSDSLFNWAEKQYSKYFSPPNQTSQVLGDYYFRYYPGTGNYLGVNTTDLDVHVLGDIFGGQMRIDTLQALMISSGLSSTPIVDPSSIDELLPEQGITGSIDGTAYTLNEKTLVVESSGYIQISGRTNDNARAWNLQFALQSGSQTCNRNTILISFQKDLLDPNNTLSLDTNDSGSVNALTRCEINVLNLTDSQIEGNFMATMVDQHDTQYTISSGYFKANRN